MSDAIGTTRGRRGITLNGRYAVRQAGGLLLAAGLLAGAATAQPSRIIALRHDFAPGTAGGTYNSLDVPVIDNAGRVAYLAGLVGGDSNSHNATAIYVHDGASATMMVRRNDVAPGFTTAYRFQSLSAPNLNNDGGLCFSGVYTIGCAGNPGYWIIDGAGYYKVVASGTPKPGDPNGSFEVPSNAAYSMGSRIAFDETLFSPVQCPGGPLAPRRVVGRRPIVRRASHRGCTCAGRPLGGIPQAGAPAPQRFRRSRDGRLDRRPDGHEHQRHGLLVLRSLQRHEHARSRGRSRAGLPGRHRVRQLHLGPLAERLGPCRVRQRAGGPRNVQQLRRRGVHQRLGPVGMADARERPAPRPTGERRIRWRRRGAHQ